MEKDLPQQAVVGSRQNLSGEEGTAGDRQCSC